MKFEKETNLYQDQALARKFKSQDTEFEIIQGHINAVISESEIRELINGGKTMYSAMNDIKIDVNGLSANLSTLSSTVNGDSGKIGTLETNYAKYKAEVDKYVADLSTTTQTANDAMSKASSVEATASGIGTTVTAVEKNLRDNYYNGTTTDDKLATVANNASTALTAAVQAMQAQVDGKIETWANYGVPTANNKPASDWTTADLKNAHVGDIYYDTNTGKVYEYQRSGNNYFWNTTQTASGIQNALTAAQDANTLADTKKQIFTSQPTTANDYYNVGDLWVNATYDNQYSNDLLRCKTAKAKGDEFSIDHWEKASKYTDDSKADSVEDDLHRNYYTIAQTNTMFTQTSEAITSTVSAKYTADNLIRNGELTTELGDIVVTNIEDENIEFVTDNSKLCLKLSPRSTESTTTPNLKFPISDTMNEKTADYNITITEPVVVTISAEVKITTSSDSYVRFRLPNYSGSKDDIKKSHDSIYIGGVSTTAWSYMYIDITDLSGTGWQKIWVTFTLGRNSSSASVKDIRLMCEFSSVGSVFLRHVKLEYGGNPTAWTPAREDVSMSGDEIVSRINQTASAVMIQAGRINLNGFISANRSFTIDENGFFSADGGSVGGWIIDSNVGLYTYSENTISGNRSYTVFRKIPDSTAGSTTVVFAAGADSLSDTDIGKASCKIYSDGTMRLSGSLILNGALTASQANLNSSINIGANGYGLLTTSTLDRTGYPKGNNYMSLNTRGLNFWSTSTTGSLNQSQIGGLSFNYNSTTDKYDIILAKNPTGLSGTSQDARIIIGSYVYGDDMNNTIVPYISVNYDFTNLIKFHVNIDTNFRVVNPDVTSNQLLTTYNRISFSRPHSGGSGGNYNYMNMYSDLTQDSSLVGSGVSNHLKNYKAGIKILSEDTTYCIIINAKGIMLWTKISGTNTYGFNKFITQVTL